MRYVCVGNNPVVWVDFSGYYPEYPYDVIGVNKITPTIPTEPWLTDALIEALCESIDLDEILTKKINLITKEQLEKIGWKNVSDEVVTDLNNTLHRYEINTPNRIAHFIAHINKESGYG